MPSARCAGRWLPLPAEQGWGPRKARPDKPSFMLNIEEIAKNGELFDGHYLLLRPLSVDGATADVWLALDTNTVAEEDKGRVADVPHMADDDIERLGLIVAIKIYRPQNALDIEGEQRFRDEYMIVFNCHHTNLIHPTQFSIFRDTPYLVLPYCRLGSSELLIGRKLTPDAIWRYVLDVASGLAYLHALDPPIVHQDIKPANILLDDTHHYAITDFGISSQKGGVHGYYNDEEKSGTFAYMAPERFQADTDPMPQSDIWAFGATLFEILTGKVPFGEDGGRTQASTDAPVPEIKGIPADIQRLIEACLAKEPGDRPSAQQIVEAARARQYPVRSHRRLYTVMAVAGAAIVAGLVAFFAARPAQQPPVPPEELYAAACARLDSDNADTIRAGLAVMDSLGNTGYVPAIYQVAFTYGWYSDSVSVRRKRLLGIEMYPSYIPKADRYSNKAVALFTRIMELNDTAYADINANATYRLACYYVMPNDIYKRNDDKGKRFLRRSRYWAEKAGDAKLLDKIDRGLASFETTKQ